MGPGSDPGSIATTAAAAVMEDRGRSDGEGKRSESVGGKWATQQKEGKRRTGRHFGSSTSNHFS